MKGHHRPGGYERGRCGGVGGADRPPGTAVLGTLRPSHTLSQEMAATGSFPPPPPQTSVQHLLCTRHRTRHCQGNQERHSSCFPERHRPAESADSALHPRVARLAGRWRGQGLERCRQNIMLKLTAG